MSEPACTMVLDGPNAGGTFTLTLKSPFAGPLKLNGASYSSLLSVGKQVRASLEYSKIGIGGLAKVPDAESMYEALEDLRQTGWVALSALVSDARFPDQPDKLRQYLSKVLEDRPATMVPVLRFESGELDLPIDLMPALQPPPRVRFRRNSALMLYEQARSWFVGLQFVVQKIQTGEKYSGTDLINSRESPDGKRVVLAPYRHTGLAGQDQVRRQLSDLGFFQVLHPLPDDKFPRMRDSEAADLIVHGREPPEGPEGIVHITSHCVARDIPSSLDHYLLLAGGPAWHRGQLQVTVKSLTSLGAGRARHGPLAVITACGAADVSYDSPVSFPGALLYAGFRCVVSPLVSVHVDPGYAVTLFLYEAMKKGMSVGAALVAARNRLLKERGHTLGLLHACYGDTRLRFDDEIVDSPPN